jgi:hypothetical protein
VTIKVVSETLGGHVHQRVFVGPDRDHLALAGELVFSEQEARAFEAMLVFGAASSRGAHQFIDEVPEGRPLHWAVALLDGDKEPR